MFVVFSQHVVQDLLGVSLSTFGCLITNIMNR